MLRLPWKLFQHQANISRCITSHCKKETFFFFLLLLLICEVRNTLQCLGRSQGTHFMATSSISERSQCRHLEGVNALLQGWQWQEGSRQGPGTTRQGTAGGFLSSRHIRLAAWHTSQGTNLWLSTFTCPSGLKAQSYQVGQETVSPCPSKPKCITTD